jgi:hypothetical protein
MPTSFPHTLSDFEFAASVRLRLGLQSGLANAHVIRCGSTVLPDSSDHPLTCTCITKQQKTPRHEMLRRVGTESLPGLASIPPTSLPSAISPHCALSTLPSLLGPHLASSILIPVAPALPRSFPGRRNQSSDGMAAQDFASPLCLRTPFALRPR